jgi:hypothetical protein
MTPALFESAFTLHNDVLHTPASNRCVPNDYNFALWILKIGPLQNHRAFPTSTSFD